MISLFALAVGTAAGVAVDAVQGQHCPSAEQVTTALANHAVTSSTNSLRLRVDGKPGAPTIHLLDSGGNEILTRALHSPAAPDDCVALADTVALIVERYLDEVEMKRLETSMVVVATKPVVVQPLPENFRAWAFGLRLLGRTGRPGVIVPGAEAWVGRRVDWKSIRWTVDTAVGGLVPDSSKSASDSVTVNLLETWLAVRVGPWAQFGGHFLGVQAEAGAGFIRGSRTPVDGPARSDWGMAPWLGISARYRHGLGEWLFVEASLGAELSLVRHELVIEFLPDKSRRVVATTPRFFSDFGLSLGLQF